MSSTWPGTVRHTPVSGSMSVDEPFRPPNRTDMEGGNRRGRRMATLNVATASFALRLDNPEFATFKAFVRDELVDGTADFTMPIWTGAAYETRTCRNISYTANPGGGFFHDVAITLEVEDF